MPYIIEKTECYRVINPDTKRVHAKCSTLKNAQRQIDLLTKKEGGNVIVDIAEKIGLSKRDPSKFPPKIRSMLTKYGSETVSSLTVARVPLSGFVTRLLNLISLGQYDKAVRDSPYNNMLHLAVIINNRFTLEKNSVLNFVENINFLNQKDVETMDVPISSQFTIQEMFDRTAEKIGMKSFTNYRATSTNCQHLVLSVLEANGLLTDDLRQFIYQDPKEVFGRLDPIVAKIGQTLVDADAIKDRLIEGESIKKKKSGGEIKQMDQQTPAPAPAKKMSAYNQFVKEYYAKHKGTAPSKDLMKQAAAEYRKTKA
jgi:hypothetical protein